MIVSPMFDVLDVIIPDLPSDPRLQWVHRSSAFGDAEDEALHWCGIPFGRRSDPEWSRAKCFVREPWLTLSAGREAAAAAVTEDTWQVFLAGIRFTLDASANWVVLFEADCDQHPLARVKLTPSALAQRLDDQRRQRDSSLALIVGCD